MVKSVKNKNDSNSLAIYQSALQAIKSGSIANCYLLSGNEQYLQLNLLQELFNALGLPTDKQTAIDYHEIDCQYKLSNLDWQSLLAELNMPPFLLRKRLILIRNSNFWHGALSAANQDFFKTFLEIVQDNNLAATCIFLEEKVDKRLKHYTTLSKSANCQVYNFDFLPETVLLKWAGNKFLQAGIKVRLSLLESLIVEPNNSMLQLNNEINKLILYCQSQKVTVLDEKMVAALVPKNLSATVFELMDAVGNKNLEAALSILKTLQLNKEPFPRLLLMLGRHCRELLLCKLSSTGNSAVKPDFPLWKFKKLQTQAQIFSSAELAELLIFVAEVDMALKFGLADEASLADLLLAKLQNAQLPVKFA